MDRNQTVNTAYGHCPREIPDVLKPLERMTPLRRFMVRVDWMLLAACVGFFACTVVW